MFYENMPLYPGMGPAHGPEGCMKVRLFEDGCGGHPPAMRECERVTIENPCRCGERAEVVLGVDACGNLVICVHRDGCEPRPKPHRPGCWEPCHLPHPWPDEDDRGGCRIPCPPPRGCGPRRRRRSCCGQKW